jgi:hypothetical protein
MKIPGVATPGIPIHTTFETGSELIFYPITICRKTLV